jgi:hypothetical protein
MNRQRLIAYGGVGLMLAGLLYLPLLANGWQGMEAIGTPVWTLVYAAATAHHLFLLFGLNALFALQMDAAGRLGVFAFVTASVGNALVGAIGIVQLTVLPALKANPDAQTSLICLPFYEPATESAAGFVARACSVWNFDLLAAISGVAWLIMLIGSVSLGLSMVLAGLLPRVIGSLLILGWLAGIAATASPRLDLLAAAAYAAIAFAYIWAGSLLARRWRN